MAAPKTVLDDSTNQNSGMVTPPVQVAPSPGAAPSPAPIPGSPPPPPPGHGPTDSGNVPDPFAGNQPMLPTLPPAPTFTAPPTATPPAQTDDGTQQATATAPVTRTVDAGKETVQGQLAGMLAKGSPVLDRAQAISQQSANARGLVNSSMATEAGTAAVIDKATEIAQADANVYGTASRDNQVAQNQAAQATATAQNQFASQRLAGQMQISQQAFAAQNDMLKLVAQGNIEGGLQQMKSLLALEQSQLDDSTKLMLQANDTVKGLWGQTQTNITNIMMNANLDAPAKDKAIRDQMNMLRTSMALVGSLAGDVNLMGQLDSILKPYQDIPTPPPVAGPTNPLPGQDGSGYNTGGGGGGGGG